MRADAKTHQENELQEENLLANDANELQVVLKERQYLRDGAVEPMLSAESITKSPSPRIPATAYHTSSAMGATGISKKTFNMVDMLEVCLASLSWKRLAVVGVVLLT